MKYTIEGLQQAKLLAWELDAGDAVILRFLIDFYHTGKMKKVELEGVKYFWVHYKTVLEEIPVLKIKNPALRNRFKKYTECGLMDFYLEKTSQGTFTYYRFIENKYEELISNPIDPPKVKLDPTQSQLHTKDSNTNNNISKDIYRAKKIAPNDLIEYWNSLIENKLLPLKKEGLIKNVATKHQPIKKDGKPNATYKRIVDNLKFVKNGMLYRKISISPEYLKRSNISIQILQKKFTDNEIKRVLRNLIELFCVENAPENKKVIPKSLDKLIFNAFSTYGKAEGGSSWFYAYSKNPPKKLYEKSTPKFPEEYALYRGLFNGLTSREESKLINSVNRITKFHTEQCSLLDELMAEGSFSSYCGAEGKPFNFCEMHVDWLSKLKSIKLNSIAQTDPESGLFKSFLEWVQEYHNYNFYPTEGELKILKGIYR